MLALLTAHSATTTTITTTPIEAHLPLRERDCALRGCNTLPKLSGVQLHLLKAKTLEKPCPESTQRRNLHLSWPAACLQGAHVHAQRGGWPNAGVCHAASSLFNLLGRCLSNYRLTGAC